MMVAYRKLAFAQFEGLVSSQQEQDRSYAAGSIDRIMQCWYELNMAINEHISAVERSPISPIMTSLTMSAAGDLLQVGPVWSHKSQLEHGHGVPTLLKISCLYISLVLPEYLMISIACAC